MSESPIEVLKMRFARGEITQAQYQKMLSVLMTSDSFSGNAGTISDTPADPTYQYSSHETVAQTQSTEASTQPVAKDTPFPNWIFFLLYYLPLLLFGLLLAIIQVTLIVRSLWIPYFIIVIIISAAVYGDAAAMKAGNGPKESLDSLTYSPLSWAGLSGAVWCLGLPLYLYRRPQVRERSVKEGLLIIPGSDTFASSNSQRKSAYKEWIPLGIGLLTTGFLVALIGLGWGGYISGIGFAMTFEGWRKSR